MKRKFRLLRDDIGRCICEDCKEYSAISKMCRLDRMSAVAPDSCLDFQRAYGIKGDVKMCEEEESDER